MAAIEDDHEDIILELFERGDSYNSICDCLRMFCSNERGMSSRSLRRFVAIRGIRRGIITDDELDGITLSE